MDPAQPSPAQSLLSFQCLMGGCFSFLQWPQNQSLKQMCKKCIKFLPFMINWPIYVHSEQDTMWGCLVFYLYFIFAISLLTEQMCQPSKDVSLKIESEMEWGNVGTVGKKHAQVTIFQTAQTYALSLVRNVNSIVDVKVWIMRGVVLQGLVMLMPSKAKKQYLCALNVYYDRVRKNCGIRGHNPPFLSFFEFFFSLSLSKHPVKWQVNPFVSAFWGSHGKI